MKKKFFEKPQIEIEEMKAADIICTSGQSSIYGLEEGLGYTEETW